MTYRSGGQTNRRAIFRTASLPEMVDIH